MGNPNDYPANKLEEFFNFLKIECGLSENLKNIYSADVFLGHILGQVRHSKYFGTDVWYENDCDVKNKLSTFNQICGTIHRRLRQTIRPETA